MLSLNSHSLPQLSLNSITNNPKTPISHFLVHGGSDDYIKKTTKPSSCVVYAAEKDSQQFEIDPDEAKRALQKLDQQLKTLSKKQVSSPKIRAQDVKLTRDPTQAEMPADDIFSGTFLSNLAIILVILTVFYNILFYAVIKPAIDGPDDISEPATAIESPKAAVPESFSQTTEIPIEP